MRRALVECEKETMRLEMGLRHQKALAGLSMEELTLEKGRAEQAFSAAETDEQLNGEAVDSLTQKLGFCSLRSVGDKGALHGKGLIARLSKITGLDESERRAPPQPRTND
jgi:hypothetical protein